MMNFLKEIKAHVVLSAVVTILFGLFLIIYPTSLPFIVCKVIGAALIVMGIIGFISFIMAEGYQRLFTIGALIIIVIGIWFVTHPATVISLIPIIVGIIMIYHGIGDLSLWNNAKQVDLPHQTGYLIAALLSIGLGLICIIAAMKVVKIGMILIGIFLIYDGISDLIIGVNVGKGNRAYSRSFREDEPIDVDYEETDAPDTDK